MSDNDVLAPVLSEAEPPAEPRKSISQRLRREASPSWQRIWLSILLIIGLLTLGFVGLYTWNFVRGIQIPSSTLPPVPVSTMTIQRSAPYAGLNFTIVNAQYATTFADDNIHSGAAVVRVNLLVNNTTGAPVSIVYYDDLHLLTPKGDPIAPANLKLATSLPDKATLSGWVDFPVAQKTALNDLQLQFGSASQNESLVTIPFVGKFDAGSYADKSSSQSLTIPYTYHAQYGLYLNYHLVTVTRSFAYKGVQAKAGQEFYTFAFKVDNPNGVAVSPGLGYDYIRVLVNGTPRAPIDNTLLYSYKAGAHGVTGHVTYSGPAGMNSFTLRFLLQYGTGGQDYPARLK